MKLTYLTLAAAFVVTAAFAAEDAAMADTNGDGVLSQDELIAAYPEITDEVLTAIDTDADGVITVEEHAAALEAGLVKPAG
jgi:hypothetical protein